MSIVNTLPTRKLQAWSLALLAASAFLPSTARADVITFNNVTNGVWNAPVYMREPYELSDVYFAGPYLQPKLTARNPANGTTALKLTGAPSGSYVLLSVGYYAPFTFNSLDVVSISGTLIISDAAHGAYYTNNGTTGRITLGSAFHGVQYVDLFINGEVVIDNIHYTVLHHKPVAAIRVLNEIRPTRLLDDDVPSHLDDDEKFWIYPGFKRFTHYILAPSTNPVPFVVDGSASISPDGEPLAYDWSYYVGGDDGDWYPLRDGAASASPCFTNQSPYLGNGSAHEMILHVKGAYHEDLVWFGVRVFTPEQATTVIWDWLANHFDRARGPVRRRLVPTLREAEAQFRDGQTEAALATLKTFQRQTKLTFRYAPGLKHTLLDFSQQIIDVVSAGQP